MLSQKLFRFLWRQGFGHEVGDAVAGPAKLLGFGIIVGMGHFPFHALVSELLFKLLFLGFGDRRLTRMIPGVGVMVVFGGWFAGCCHCVG